MKKVLLASTALVLTAGVAAADVTVTGSANMGVQYIEDAFVGSDGDTADFGIHYELDFNVVGSGTTDNGLTFGASLDLDLDDGAESDFIDDPEVFLEGAFGRLTFGAIDSASDNLTLGISDIGFDGIGVDDDSDTFIGAGNANVLYTGTFADFAIVLSAGVPDSDEAGSDDFGIGVGYAFGDFEVAAAYENAADDNIYYLGFQGGFGQFSIDTFVHYAEDADITAGGVSGAFDAGNGLAITAAVGLTDIDDEDADYGVGFEYDLGGAVLAGGVGSVDDNVVADLGFNFSF